MDLVKQQEEIVDKLQAIALELLKDQAVTQAAVAVQTAATATDKLMNLKVAYAT